MIDDWMQAGVKKRGNTESAGETTSIPRLRLLCNTVIDTLYVYSVLYLVLDTFVSVYAAAIGACLDPVDA